MLIHATSITETQKLNHAIINAIIAKTTFNLSVYTNTLLRLKIYRIDSQKCTSNKTLHFYKKSILFLFISSQSGSPHW